jgi:hypothetical protein
MNQNKCCDKCWVIAERENGFIKRDFCNDDNCPCHSQDEPKAEGWAKALNIKINGYLSVGTDNNSYEEWISEDDQIEMRKDLKEFITEILSSRDKEWEGKIKEKNNLTPQDK